MTDRPGIIYLAVNRVNGKAYVGQTTYDLGVRVRAHMSRRMHHSANHFQRSLGKHGIEQFEFALLEWCASKLELNAAERRWIQHMGSIEPHGYNVAAGGEGSLCNKRSAAWYAAVKSEEVRKRHSQNVKAWRARQTPEERASHNAKVGDANRGKERPMHRGDGNPAKKPESRVRISEGLRRSWQDPEVRARRDAAWKRYRESRTQQ